MFYFIKEPRSVCSTNFFLAILHPAFFEMENFSFVSCVGYLKCWKCPKSLLLLKTLIFQTPNRSKLLGLISFIKMKMRALFLQILLKGSHWFSDENQNLDRPRIPKQKVQCSFLFSRFSLNTPAWNLPQSPNWCFSVFSRKVTVLNF